MSAKELRFTKDRLTWFRAYKEGDTLKFKLIDGTEFPLDRNQAHLLKLWLEEHLK